MAACLRAAANCRALARAFLRRKARRWRSIWPRWALNCSLRPAKLRPKWRLIRPAKRLASDCLLCSRHCRTAGLQPGATPPRQGPGSLSGSSLAEPVAAGSTVQAAALLPGIAPKLKTVRIAAANSQPEKLLLSLRSILPFHKRMEILSSSPLLPAWITPNFWRDKGCPCKQLYRPNYYTRFRYILLAESRFW